MTNKNTTQNKYDANVNLTKLSAPDLWDRIKSQQARLAGDAAFLARLRSECPTAGPDPNPLILEYLRFAYLAWTMPEGATPSIAVDGVWHAHLLFTRSYERFCRETAGRTLHHDPGGGDSGGGYEEAYLRTLDGYEAEFGPPPGWHWPRPTPPKAEPPPASPAQAGSHGNPAPKPSILGPAVIAASASLGTFLATSNPFFTVAAGLSACLLAAVVAIPTSPPPSRRTTTRRRNADGGGSSCVSDGGVAATSAGDACADGGSGSCGDGGGGGSSCGSSCGGGGCGGA